jgi:hypothetical protein
MPEPEAFAMLDRGEKPPERMANALQLEWFSDSNGRVLIESTDYELTISPPQWRLSPAEEKQRAKDAEAAWAGFVGRLDEALEKQNAARKTRRRTGTSTITRSS